MHCPTDAGRAVREGSISTEDCRIIFDLSLSARWPGPPTGMIQTERQLASYAASLATSRVEYSFHHPTRKRYFRLRSGIAARIIRGEIRIDDAPPRIIAPPPQAEVRKQGLLSRLFGHAWQVPTPPLPQAPPLPPANPFEIAFADAVDGEIEFRATDILFSGGADWHDKDFAWLRGRKSESGLRYACMCYDLIPWTSPQYFTTSVGPLFVSYLPEMIETSDLVFCISRNTERTLASFCADRGLAMPRTGILRLGDTVSPAAPVQGLPAEVARGRFVLMVGSIEPRKNHWAMYHVWEALTADPEFPPDIKLAVVGNFRWMTDDLLTQIANHPVLRERMPVLKGVDDLTLAAMYRDCLFTVYPSFDEGWGLPVAESLSHGKMCIASNRGSLPEISPIPVLIDPLDLQGWRAAIKRLVLDDNALSAAEDRIRREHRPTGWDASARTFYDQLADLHRAAMPGRSDAPRTRDPASRSAKVDLSPNLH